MSSSEEPRDPHPYFPNETIYLWDEDSVNNGSHPPYRPMIRIYYPAEWDETPEPRPAMLICPGGGYHVNARHEGQPFAQLLAIHGIVGVVLTYRVYPDQYPAAYDDAVRAMRMLRSRADTYSIDPERIGIMGFSAGGHLAATVATQPELHTNTEDELATRISAAPSRLALGYPVISFTADAHQGSREALLGPSAGDEQARLLSGELHVSPSTPSTFLFHTADDAVVPVQNSLAFASACAAHGVPFELHVYESGRHGVGMAATNRKLRTWSTALIKWLEDWTAGR